MSLRDFGRAPQVDRVAALNMCEHFVPVGFLGVPLVGVLEQHPGRVVMTRVEEFWRKGSQVLTWGHRHIGHKLGHRIAGFVDGVSYGPGTIGGPSHPIETGRQVVLDYVQHLVATLEPQDAAVCHI